MEYIGIIAAIIMGVGLITAFAIILFTQFKDNYLDE